MRKAEAAHTGKPKRCKRPEWVNALEGAAAKAKAVRERVAAGARGADGRQFMLLEDIVHSLCDCQSTFGPANAEPDDLLRWAMGLDAVAKTDPNAALGSSERVEKLAKFVSTPSSAVS